ncbi:Rib1p [Malassezia vespertilionis]|uniref:GTP cyclohydrolase II n=1 Tax=Malassezia vespertilionis TaxID=2020962 RepID=A0A2N1JH01_9BASI|nr:Rib1p [Malassezia vespertilionis]
MHKSMRSTRTESVSSSADPRSDVPIDALCRIPSAYDSRASNPDDGARNALPPLQVWCYGRTRIPTPHGEVFCHLYKNNHDNKEHLALVIDPAQNQSSVQRRQEEHVLSKPRHIRSRTLDAVWHPNEKPMDRITRGAYVGRLSADHQVQSTPADAEIADGDFSQQSFAKPLVRIHSECYTGETIGSRRCDCGEQLDEALRLISKSSTRTPENQPTPPRGVVVYMRQEGRGIGLLDKLMAYNLQDMGHDTVAANVMLGHLPDARKYDIASAILRDLGINACRLLTNNPDKMKALEDEHIHVEQRVPMVPRMWQVHNRNLTLHPNQAHRARNVVGATMDPSSARSNSAAVEMQDSTEYDGEKEGSQPEDSDWDDETLENSASLANSLSSSGALLARQS